ncbi:MAG: hypothetical protein LBR31_02305 [Desulfovibrio sp.]|jgi:hypothetical protein|nr:hypothetical protein [Desulfovibrio sp.]
MDDLKRFSEYCIDWNLTPEHAVTMYLEFGNNDWRGEYPPVRSKSDVVHYFVVDSWQDPPVIRLVERSYEGAVDLMEMPLPERFLGAFRAEHGNCRGVVAPDEAVKDWLKAEMYGT